MEEPLNVWIHMFSIRKNPRNKRETTFSSSTRGFWSIITYIADTYKRIKRNHAGAAHGWWKNLYSGKLDWICRNILSKGIKVLWLAQSSYLLDQAAQTFEMKFIVL
jgi:hypothetical protein